MYGPYKETAEEWILRNMQEGKNYSPANLVKLTGIAESTLNNKLKLLVNDNKLSHPYTGAYTLKSIPINSTKSKIFGIMKDGGVYTKADLIEELGMDPKRVDAALQEIISKEYVTRSNDGKTLMISEKGMQEYKRLLDEAVRETI